MGTVNSEYFGDVLKRTYVYFNGTLERAINL
jgi:hypothetical protein